MKKTLIRIASLVLTLAMVLAMPVIARADSINLGVAITNGTDTITVTVDNSKESNNILAAQTPTLTIPCSFDEAYVKYGNKLVDYTLSGSEITFTVDKGGAYTVVEGEKPDAFTVTFQTNGAGEIPAISNLLSDSKVTKPEDPSREGYTFNGWYQDEDCTDEWDFETDTVYGNITLYAGWTKIVYTVTFQSNGGSEVAPASNIISGSKLTKPTDPTKNGYTFTGWYKDDDCTDEWDFDTDTVTGTRTLYAGWDEILYTVTYQSNGGSAVASVSNLSSGSKLTKPADPSRSGYTFAGWYQDAACTDEWDFDTDTVSGNMTLYAGWTEILPVVTGVTVTPAAADVKQGKTQQFTAVLTGTNVSGVAVTWTVTGAKDTATAIDSTGKLTVGSKETEDLTVTATAGGKTGTAIVDVKQVYTITVGNWRKGSGKDLTVYVNAPVAELLNVRIDGEILNTNRYTAFGTTGTTIKLKNSYLETCPAGTYSIEVEYEDGDAEETFKIKKEIVNAETGDFFNLYLWIGMLVLSFSAVVVLLAMRRKRKW